MKKSRIFVYASLLVLCLFCSLVFCKGRCYASSAKAKTTFYTDFNKYNPIVFNISEKVSGQSPKIKWLKKNVNFKDGKMALTMNKNSSGIEGGEVRLNGVSTYGLYKVRMKPVKHSGVVSSYFLYGNWGSSGTEIDIEFLGKDTTKVQFNYYKNGGKQHAYLYNLGFDASKEYHNYSIFWTSDSIYWYVDNKLAHQAHQDIPQSPACIYMDVWGGIYPDWMGKYDGATKTAYYDWISYTSLADMDSIFKLPNQEK